jgi:hypothetical protein
VATTRDIITSALKKLGVLRAGGTASDGAATDALSSLSSYYQELITNGTCGRVWDIPLSRSFDGNAGVNQHINILTEDPVTIDLPSIVPYTYWNTWRPYRDYGWGLNVPIGGDNGDNVPPDKAVVRITSEFDENRATYIYDGTIQRWMRIDNLTLDSEAPLSARNSDGLAAVMAIRLADQYGDTLISQATPMAANRYRLAMVTNYGNPETQDGYW